MAMIDEEKLQHNVAKILDLLRKEAVCCSVVSAQWMCDADSGTAVWVTVNEAGAIVVYDGPGGVVITPVGPLGPVDASGNCPAAPFVAEITDLVIAQAACNEPLDGIQFYDISFDTNIPLGAYQLQAFLLGVWTDINSPFPFIGPGTYSDTGVQIVPDQNLEGDISFRVLETSSGTIGGPAVVTFTTCVP